VRHAVAKDPAGLPTGSKALPEIRKQALIWRQLVTRDKEPEAYLQRKDRARVRHEFNRLIWRSLLRPLPIVAAVICAALTFAMFRNGSDLSATTKTLVSILGARRDPGVAHRPCPRAPPRLDGVALEPRPGQGRFRRHLPRR